MYLCFHRVVNFLRNGAHGTERKTGWRDMLEQHTQSKSTKSTHQALITSIGQRPNGQTVECGTLKHVNLIVHIHISKWLVVQGFVSAVSGPYIQWREGTRVSDKPLIE